MREINKWHMLCITLISIYGGSYMISEITVNPPNWVSVPTFMLLIGGMTGLVIYTIIRFMKS